ncbi:hypothetical protein YTPLAS18_18380 [Nitrospira sp.]|nr:hypothetical protein YTPLAS18_18380 [Nitrospira sp.]
MALLIVRTILAGLTALVALVLATLIIALGFPFYLVSFLVRTLASRLEPPCIQWPDLFKFDPTIGWKARENVDSYCLDERDDIFHVLTDNQGWPGRRHVDDSDVVVFGDSHAFGYGVDHERAFWQVDCGVKIKAIGVPGYNMVQESMLLERLAPQLRHKMVAWFCYVGNDLFDNLCPEMLGYRMPFLRQANYNGTWEIVTSHLSPDPWTGSIGARAVRRSGYPLIPALHSDTPLSRRSFSACEFLIARGHQACRKHGARLVVVSIPEPFALDPQQISTANEQYPYLKDLSADYPDRKLGAMCQKAGVEFVALREYLELCDYKRAHDHWTERGHRRVADVLTKLYLAKARSNFEDQGYCFGLSTETTGLLN